MRWILALLLGAACAPPDSIDVAECAGDADVADVTAMADDFELSAAHMIRSGALGGVMVNRLLTNAHDLYVGAEGLPEHLSYADGTYSVIADEVRQEIWLSYTADSPVGEPGERVMVDLFEFDSFLVGAEIEDTEDGVSIDFEEPGPLAAFLGQGAHPESPMLLSDDEVGALAINLGTLELDGVIAVEEVGAHGTIRYEVVHPAQALETFWPLPLLPMELTSATGERPELSQTLQTHTWDVDYDHIFTYLGGEIAMDFIGGPFDFRATYTYVPAAADTGVDIRCLD